MALSNAKGPGKFEGELLVTEYLYEVSLHGTCDEEHEGAAQSWAGLFTGELWMDLDDLPEDWTDEDRAFFLAQRGAILTSSSNGFVGATYFETEEAALAAWAEETAEWEADEEYGRDYERTVDFHWQNR